MKALKNGHFEEPEGISQAAEALPLGMLIGKRLETPDGFDVIVSDVRHEDTRYIKLEPQQQEGRAA